MHSTELFHPALQSGSHRGLHDEPSGGELDRLQQVDLQPYIRRTMKNEKFSDVHSLTRLGCWRLETGAIELAQVKSTQEDFARRDLQLPTS